MSWALVQRTPGGTFGSDVDTETGSALNLTAFSSAVTLSNIVLAIVWGTASTAPSFSCGDNASPHNSWSTLWSTYDATSQLFAAVFGATITQNPTGGPTLTVIPVAGGASSITGCAAEFSGGTLTLDGSAVTATGTGGTAAPGTLTISMSDDLIIGVMTDTVTASVTITTPSGFTDLGTLESNGVNFAEGQACYELGAALASDGGTALATDNGVTPLFNAQIAPTWGTGGALNKYWVATVLALQASPSTFLGLPPRLLTYVPFIDPDPDWQE